MSKTDSLEHTVKRKILLVDDNSINRRIMGRFLQGMDLDVTDAKDGFEAIELIQENEFSIIFMDIIMPKIDGYETTRRIRALEGPIKNIPIIAVTADAVTGLTEEMASAGMNDVLAKPFTKEQLNALLDKYFHTIVHVLQHLHEGLDVFDKRHFESFYDDASLRKDIVETFLEEKDNDIKRVEEAFKSKDNETIYKALHYLKGSFSYLKAAKILKMTQYVLDTSKEERLDKVLQYEKPFIECYLKLNKALDIYFKTL